jgi:hypothetical protein
MRFDYLKIFARKDPVKKFTCVHYKWYKHNSAHTVCAMHDFLCNRISRIERYLGLQFCTTTHTICVLHAWFFFLYTSQLYTIANLDQNATFKMPELFTFATLVVSISRSVIDRGPGMVPLASPRRPESGIRIRVVRITDLNIFAIRDRL